MSWIYNCFHSEESKFRERESGYIRELTKVSNNLITITHEKIAIEERYREDLNRWESKENAYHDKINELQALLHQQDVVMKQYQIYEGNFQQDRVQLHEIQKNVEDLKRTVINQREIIEKLENENRKFLGENDSGYSSEISGPHITTAILV